MSNQGRAGLTEAPLELVPAKPNGKLDMQKSNDLAGCHVVSATRCILSQKARSPFAGTNSTNFQNLLQTMQRKQHAS